MVLAKFVHFSSHKAFDKHPIILRHRSSSTIKERKQMSRVLIEME